MRKNDTLCILYEFDNLKGEFFAKLSLRAILFHKVLRSGKSLTTFIQGDNGSLIHQLGDFTLMYRTWSINSLISIPRIIFELLVTKAQTTVLLINIKNDYVDFGTNGREL